MKIWKDFLIIFKKARKRRTSGESGIPIIKRYDISYLGGLLPIIPIRSDLTLLYNIVSIVIYP